MALSLIDLLGETVLVARDPPRGTHAEENTLDPPLANTPTIENNTYTDQAELGDNRSGDSEINENRSNVISVRTADECGGGRERRESGDGNLDDTDTERYSLVTKDGVVLDIVNVEELVGPDTVIGLYFASSGVPECRYLAFSYYIFRPHL